MNSSFWLSKPVAISNNIQTIIDCEPLLEKINKEITLNKYQIDYTVYKTLTSDKLNKILNFINTYYVSSNDYTFQLQYSKDLFLFFIHNALVIEFYPKNNPSKIVGYIVGKKTPVYLYNKIFNSSEVNFLCVIPTLRKMGVSSYMINVLSKEIILHYNITTSHYTISSQIKSHPFGTKQLYHRIINVPTLCHTKFIKNSSNFSDLVKTFNVFNYNQTFKNSHYIKYIHNSNDITSDFIQNLYIKYIKYAKDTYDVFNYISLEDFTQTFNNEMFYHFIIYNKNHKIISYICLFQLDSINVYSRLIYRSGFYYYMFFQNPNLIIDSLELVNEYIHNNDIFDVITFSDIFNIDPIPLKCIEGSCSLNYYFYNLQCPVIPNHKNGLITI